MPLQQPGDNRTPGPPLARAIRYLTGEAGLRQFLVEPGLVRVPEWRPAMAIDAKAPAQMWAGVALKPAPKPALKP